MTTEELQQLARQFGSVVVLKDDKPSFVFLTFEKYKDLLRDEEKEVTVSHFSRRDSEHSRMDQGHTHPRTGISFNGSNGLNLSKGNYVETPNTPERAEGHTHPQRAEVTLTPDREIMEKLNREVMALKDEIRTKEEQEY